MKDRNYRAEYLRWQASDEAKADRAARNKVRNAWVKKGKVKRGDTREIDHIDGDPRNNAPSNLRLISQSKNRAKH